MNPFEGTSKCVGENCNDPMCGYEPEVCDHCKQYEHACWFTCEEEHCCPWKDES